MTTGQGARPIRRRRGGCKAWCRAVGTALAVRSLHTILSLIMPSSCAQDGRCAISGLPFSLTRFEGVLAKHPFAPSLDRISSRGSYTADNVRLVCIAVNFGMGQWGEELYLTFARATVEQSDKIVFQGAQTAEVLASSTGPQMADEADTWSAGQRERIAAAEAIASVLRGKALVRQRRRIASLKRNLTLGPVGLKAAAVKAVATRRG